MLLSCCFGIQLPFEKEIRFHSLLCRNLYRKIDSVMRSAKVVSQFLQLKVVVTYKKSVGRTMELVH